MKKRFYIFLLMISLTSAGCSKTEAAVEIIDNNESITTDTVSKEPSVENKSDDEEASFSFHQLKHLEFLFSSGAGAWGTVLTIDEEGHFSGQYSDSDMGSNAAEYPHGTHYECTFEGQFTDPVKVNEHTWSMQISEINYSKEIGTEEIKNQIRYIYSEPYGLEQAENILIYLPGTPVDELPEEYKSWVRYYIETEGDGTELPFYGLYNEKQQHGFSSSNIMDSLYEMLEASGEHAASVEETLLTADLNQAELNEQASLLYQIWDSALNQIWSVLQNTLDKDVMDTLTIEEREWITYKEQSIAEAASGVGGGSMASMIANQRAAALTKNRCYELMDYLIYENAADRIYYSGYYADRQGTEDIYSSLHLSYIGDDRYEVQAYLYRLTALTGTAVLDGDRLIFTDKDMPLTAELLVEDSSAVLTVTESKTESVKQGEVFTFSEKIY